MKQIYEDLASHIELFFQDLNWTYIIMFLVVLYGMKHKIEFQWFVRLVDRNWWSGVSTWVAGLIVAVLFAIFRALGADIFDSEYVAQLLRSYVVVIVFNSLVTKDKIEGDD